MARLRPCPAAGGSVYAAGGQGWAGSAVGAGAISHKQAARIAAVWVVLCAVILYGAFLSQMVTLGIACSDDSDAKPVYLGGRRGDTGFRYAREQSEWYCRLAK